MRVHAALAATLAILCPDRVASARPPAHIELAVRVDVARRAAAGRMSAEITNTSDVPLDHLELWRFPARLAKVSPALDDHNFYWQYPNRFDPASMALSALTVGGQESAFRIDEESPAGAGTLVSIPLAAPLPPGPRCGWRSISPPAFPIAMAGSAATTTRARWRAASIPCRWPSASTGSIAGRRRPAPTSTSPSTATRPPSSSTGSRPPRARAPGCRTRPGLWWSPGRRCRRCAWSTAACTWSIATSAGTCTAASTPAANGWRSTTCARRSR